VLSDLSIIVAGLLWLGLLFGVAVWGERRGAWLTGRWHWVYALSLAVYCTSWTFYGTVTQAARSGWPIPPTFIGTILLYLFGFGLLVKLVRLSAEHNASSLADLIATRLGKNAVLAAAVTAVAVLGMLPYIALQLKAVAMSYGLMTRASRLAPPAWQDSALYVALVLALFAMLFGTRRASATEHNRGLVLAMAFESLLKLGAMLAVGLFVAFGLPVFPDVALPATDSSGFAPLVLLGALAMFTLPHQFHVGVVECRNPRHLNTARWLFPLYMVLIALPLLPLAKAGQALLAPQGIPSDLYVLALPLSQGQEGIALLAFLGGLSAAVGMVILATLSLSVMIGNHWLAPLLVRGRWAHRSGGDLQATVLWQRRAAILVLLLLAWLYSRSLVGNNALADIGAVSFSALGTLAPALAFAIWRPHTPPLAVLAGLAVSVAVWVWTLLLPSLADAELIRLDWRSTGPFGIVTLAPDALFGLTDWSRLARALVPSLVLGAAVTWLLSRRPDARPTPAAAVLGDASLRALALRFLPLDRVDAALANPDPELRQQRIERDLASVLGAASARLLLETARRRDGDDLETVVDLVGETSQALHFNQQVLGAALENMSQGISVVDAELRLVAWNGRYAQLFGFPAELLRVGRPIADLAGWAIDNGFVGLSTDPDAALSRRLEHMRAGTGHLSERRFPDGTVVEIRGNPMPGGGFVATFTDVTAFRRAEAELKRIAESLEQRVAERTAELARASAEAERANRAKSRLLAAVSHDLAQPLHAAKLFAHALRPQLDGSRGVALDNVLSALASSETLLNDLLDLSRLEAGGLRPDPHDFRIGPLLEKLASEFGVLAAERGLRLVAIPSRAWVRSDPNLLRRVLQNFLSNAIGHTSSGRVIFGCRRRSDGLSIEVWDSGPGIAESEQSAIFDEFRRGQSVRGQGLGLGLAIARRTANLLGHPVGLRSWPGRGSVFSVRVPLGNPVSVATTSETDTCPVGDRLRILALDNDPHVLQATRALLESWGHPVACATSIDQAMALAREFSPDLAILDYRLDDDRTGLAAWSKLREFDAGMQGIVLSADRSEPVRAAVAAAGLAMLHKPLKPLALRSLLSRLSAVRSVD
jgi:signal transduction histidine kinase